MLCGGTWPLMDKRLPSCSWLHLPTPSIHIRPDTVQDMGLNLQINRTAREVPAAVQGAPPTLFTLKVSPSLLAEHLPFSPKENAVTVS